MMASTNLLRKQVSSEMRKRKLIFYTVMLLSFIYLFVSLIFGDMGILKYRELYKKKTRLQMQVQEMEQENLHIRSQIKSLKEDPFYAEKHAREDFGLAKPDEYIFQYDR
jgi:cell division protein FtsB